MKKNYIEPAICVYRVEESTPIATSPGITSEKGIGWGGYDNIGRPADARERRRNGFRNEW
jgi:hypothetical protein